MPIIQMRKLRHRENEVIVQKVVGALNKQICLKTRSLITTQKNLYFCLSVAQTPTLQNMTHPGSCYPSLLSRTGSSAADVLRVLNYLALALVMSFPASDHSESRAGG